MTERRQEGRGGIGRRQRMKERYKEAKRRQKVTIGRGKRQEGDRRGQKTETEGDSKKTKKR